ncbi:MAG: LTA synthase family protein [Ruminococcaceae bacterium]|nr:LTA synthase family protein [Oscillospiraceae bacterium]
MNMFILLATLVAFITAAIDIKFFSSEKGGKNCILKTLKNLVLVDFLSLGAAKYILRLPHFLITEGCEAKHYILFCVASIIVGAVMLAIYAFEKKYCVREEEKSKKGAIALKVISTVLFFIGCVLFFATIWTGDTFGKLTGDQIVVNMLSPAEGSDTSTYITVAEGPVFSTLLFTIIFAFIDFSKLKLIIKNKTLIADKAKRICCFVLSVAVLIGAFSFGYTKCTLYKIYNGYFVESTVLDDIYVNPRETKITFPEKKRNLIHIYLESLENSYFSKDIGGFMEMNLMPELEQLSYSGVVFSNNEGFFGGPLEATGTQWSCASMVNQTTGLPMKMPAETDSYANDEGFLPGAYTINDILHDQGYEQTLMIGADAAFGGLDTYYTTHGDVKVFDYSYAKENGLIPEDYLVWWGYEDDKLYEFAKEEITRLYETGKPFNFAMETADTHMPNGYLSENAETPYDNQYANVIAYSTSQAVEFIKWIQAQPFYEDTTIVIIGDHISMETNFFKHYGFTDDYLRTQYNCIINPAPSVANPSEKVTRNRKWSNWDYFPTILAAMGCEIEGDRLGVGTNLFSGKETIFEEKGVDYINKEFEKKSPLYNKEIFKAE